MKQAIAILIIILLVVISMGCTDGGKEYHKNAKTYALSDSQIGGSWDVTTGRTSEKDLEGLESSWVIEAEGGEDELQVAVLVFASTARCKAILKDHREEAESALDTNDYKSGWTGSLLGMNIVVNRKANVMFQVMGDMPLSNAKTLSERQADNIG